jgi:putative redox protein
MSQNDVKQALQETIAGIQANPQMSNVVFRATSEWTGDVRCEAKIRDFATLVVDEPPELGGQDSAANPVELVLAALGTCQEIMYAAYASVMDIELKSVKVNTRGYLNLQGLFGLDAEVPPGYSRIAFDTEIESPADDEAMQRLIETVENHCPVMDILSRAMTIDGTAKVNGRELHKLTRNAA